MADDEEVVFEGQELHKYLKTVGYSDYTVEKPIGSSPSSPYNSHLLSAHPSYLNRTSKCLYSAMNLFQNPWTSRAKPMDCDMLCKYKKIILESGLLFEEDVQFVTNMLPYSSHDKVVVSKRSWRSTTINLMASFPTVCFNLWQETAFPLAGFVLFDIMWIWKRNKQYKQYFEQQCNLLHSMKDLYIICSKAMRLLQENELILRGFSLARTGSTPSRLEYSDLPCMTRKWESSPGLRIAVMNILMETINILACGTQALISCCPLYGQLDHASHYMSFTDFKTVCGSVNSEDCDVKLSYLKRLHHMYLLLQSEFLRRLALCFCPPLWKRDSLKQIRNVMHIVLDVTENSSKICSNLIQEYNAFYSYGISNQTQQSNLLPSFLKSEFSYTTDTKVAVRSACLHLRTLLQNTRALEEKLETEDNLGENFEEILSHFSLIIHELEVCRSCCEEGMVQIRKLITPKEERVTFTEKSVDSIITSNEEVKQIFVGHTDLDPQVEDEVFEAVINDTESGTSYLCDEISNDEQMQYEIAKQLSKKMMQELKSVLAIKAEKWKEREAKVLLAKKIPPDSSESDNDRHVIYDSKENISQVMPNVENRIASHDTMNRKTILSNSCLSLEHKGSPCHKLLVERRTESCGSLERCTDSPVSNVSSSSRATSSKSPKHIYASETFRPLKNDLQFSVGLHLSSDALAKFQARHIGASDTFSGVGEKSSSEESLEENPRSENM